MSVQVEARLQTHNILERKDEVSVGSQYIEKKGKRIFVGVEKESLAKWKGWGMNNIF